MRLIVSIILTLLNTIASKTEPINYNGLLLSSSISDQTPNDYSNLKELISHLKQIELNKLKDEYLEWNKNNEKYNIDSENIIPLDIINENIFNDFDDLLTDNQPPIELNQLRNFLSILLKQPVWVSPLTIIDESLNDINDKIDELDKRKIAKKSRYYRGYPWKRQKNNRLRNVQDYNDSPHVCAPTREDVYKLLVALHEVRQSNKTRTINFCKRRRPVSSVITNIRFLGRRK